ncbi:hypothetical protein RsS62_53100 [Rhizobium dioscoreae]|uniref:hypothetical protein n=1 Tax=Rhizobium dioscoreae TaxID=2653122 RepID=UPI0012610441|nr:hypothetical protein [Rhizobium dioscoreae]GES46058.1 hypothetical protein RsS62_53100 [Rhizobium dioscoreae]
MYRFAIIFAAYVFATSVVAADFKRYENDRFGYVIDIPSGFKTIQTSDNGDGIGLESADGTAKLSVWGNYLTEGGFRQESELRRKFAIEDGWTFTYEKRSASWVSFSGTKGDRIIYMRQIALCDDAMGNFILEYPAAQQKRFGPQIDRMVKTLSSPKHCD